MGSINIQKVEELGDVPDFHLSMKLLTHPSLLDRATTELQLNSLITKNQNILSYDLSVFGINIKL